MSHEELNWRGTAWYIFLLFLTFLTAALVYTWALPGFALDKLYTRYRINEKGLAFALLAFWMGPLWIYTYIISRPGKAAPEWAKKKDQRKSKDDSTKKP